MLENCKTVRHSLVCPVFTLNLMPNAWHIFLQDVPEVCVGYAFVFCLQARMMLWLEQELCPLRLFVPPEIRKVPMRNAEYCPAVNAVRSFALYTLLNQHFTGNAKALLT